MASAVDILVRLRTATGNGLIDAQLALRRLENDANAGEKALKSFRGAAIGLTPALVPIAAQLAPIAAGFAAAGVAVGAFGAAVIPQIKNIGEATKAQQKAADATAKYGATSKQAVQAQQAYLDTMSKLPQATQEASVAYGDLTKSFKAWSDASAKDTMPVITKGMADLGAVLPHLTPLVEGTSKQLNRLVTVAGGGLSTPGFDKLSSKFDTFANGVVKKATDELIHFFRELSEGKADGPLTKLMDYARQNGPKVQATIKDLATALAHIGQAAADAGPGMLTVVDTLAKLVSAIPPAALTRLVQLYTAFKLIKLGAAGLAIVGGQVGTFARTLATMNTAAVAAGGGLAGVRAAFAALSTGTKVAGAIAAVAGIVLVLKSLGGTGKAAPDVAKLTTALGEFGRTGKVAGEAARVFGTDFGDLNKSIERLNGGGSGMDKFNDTMNKVFTLGMGQSNSMKEAKKSIDGIDKGLAQLVQGGNADLAAAALKRLTDEYAKTGKPTSDLTSKLDDYKSALADAKFESDLVADSQGLFGKQAQSVQKQLDAQKQSADGLRQSLQALNDVNRQGLNAESDFEQAIDDAAKAIKDHRKALKGNSDELNLNSQGARDAYAALSNLAEKTDAATSAARDQGKSWADVQDIYNRGRTSLINTAIAMGRTKEQAKALADQILKIPDKKTMLTGNIQDLQKKVASAKAQLKTVPASKTTAIKANISQLQNVIRDAQAELAALQGKTIVIRSTYVSGVGNVFHESGDYPKKAKGGKIHGPGTGTSDDVLMWGSDGEFVVTADATKKNLPVLEAMNSGKHGIAAFASGGRVSKSEQAARNQAAGSFGLSYFGYAAGYRSNAFQNATGNPGSVGDLVGTLNQWLATIRAATHGAQESKLVKAFDKFGLAALKNEKALLNVNHQLDAAQTKLSALKDSFNQLKDSVSSSVVSFGSIANHPAANALGVVEQMQGNVNQAKRFADDLARLKKQGLNAQSLSELASAGVDSGLGTADALAGASPAYIKRINDLEKQLKAAGGSAGNTAADAMYGAGIKAADGIVKGLEKSQKRIEDVMAKAALAMANTLKRAFGMKGTGGVVGTAATGGPRSGLTLVGEYGPELAHLAAGTMVRSAGDTARMLSGGGSSRPLHITLTIGDKAFGDLLVDPLRRTVRTRGGNVQAVLGT